MPDADALISYGEGYARGDLRPLWINRVCACPPDPGSPFATTQN